MIEKLLFKKIEFWLVILMVLIMIPGGILFGAVVRHVAEGGQRTGWIGEVIYQIASIPSNVEDKINIVSREGLGGLRPSDYVSKGIISTHDLSEYESVLEGEPYGPVFYSKEGVSGLQPISVQVRVRKKPKDEIIAIFDEHRNLVKTFPVKAKTMIKSMPPVMGASPHHIFDDGSYLIWPYGGIGLYRMDPCGKVIWKQHGMYHHYFSVDGNRLYILGLPNRNITKLDRARYNSSDIINIIDVDTGEILRSITTEEIAKANLPRMDPLFYPQWKRLVNKNGVLKKDFVHVNKIQVLPARLQSEYPGLPEGALMVSAKNLNVLFIFDPQTLEIVWYSHGRTQLQHDPEFIGNNRIAIFNNSRKGNHPDKEHPSNFSSIISYDFGAGEWGTMYNAQPIKGFTDFGGTFDVSEDDQMVLCFFEQGRMVEVDQNGEIIFECVSLADENSAFWFKEAQYLTREAYDSLLAMDCN